MAELAAVLEELAKLKIENAELKAARASGDILDTPIPTGKTLPPALLPTQRQVTRIVVEDTTEQIINTDNHGRNCVLRPRLLVKPCQAGKTGEALADWVIEQARIDTSTSKEVRKIAFFVCDNSLLLTKQTETRAKSADIQIEGDIIIISCKETIKCAAKLLTAIMDNQNISTILCCGNSRRLMDISELSMRLKQMSKKFELSVYVDEADKILNSPRAQQQVQIWRQPNYLIKQLLLITATPFESATKNLVEDYGEIELLPVQIVTREDYHRFSDSQHIDTSSVKSSSNVDYVADVFEKFTPELACGQTWFIPAEHKKDTHNEMQDLLFGLGFNCVIKINATNKEIAILQHPNFGPHIIPDVHTFDQISVELKGTDAEKFAPSNNEISKWLGKYYSRNNGKAKWITAITGNICISRGISIQSPECFITHAIYGPHCAVSKKNQYQIFARVCGNICKFPKYIETGPPIVYCAKKEFDETCRMEQFAINLATYSQSNGRTGGVIVDSSKMREMYEETKISLPKMYRIYNNEEILKAACAELGYKFVHVDMNSDGFKETSLNKKKAVVSLTDAIKKVSSGYGTNKGVQTHRVYYPCYRDIADKTTLHYIFLIRTTTDQGKIDALDAKYPSLYI